MSFCKSRWATDYEWEILRFASSIKIMGGASKLFNFFVKEQNPNSVFTYSERRWNVNDAVYSKLGFEKLGNTALDYWYVGNITGWRRENRMKYQKHKIATTNAESTGAERINSLGLHRIYGCGNIKWGWNKKRA